jgi:opacity protein-like surface antigen
MTGIVQSRDHRDPKYHAAPHHYGLTRKNLLGLVAAAHFGPRLANDQQTEGENVRPYEVRLTFASGLMLACFLPAFGQVEYNPQYAEWEATPFVGGSFAPDSHLDTEVVSEDGQTSSRPVGMHFASGYQVGGRVTQNFREVWAADLEYSFANQPLRLTNLSPEIQSLSLSHYIHHFSYNVSYLPMPTTRRFRPYGSLGAGAALFSLPGSSKETAKERGLELRDDWEFALNWGGGFKYLARDGFALSVDVKDQMSHLPDYGLPRRAHIANGRFQPGLTTSGIMHNWQLNLGFSFQWDE